MAPRTRLDDSVEKLRGLCILIGLKQLLELVLLANQSTVPFNLTKVPNAPTLSP